MGEQLGRGGRPRVLWITDEAPDADLGGGNVRQSHLVRGLARVADVHLLVVGDGPDAAVAAAVAEVTAVADPGLPEPAWKPFRRAHDLWLALVARGPREVALAARRRRALRPVVRRLAADVDLVVACHPGLAALVGSRGSARWVAQLHHIGSAQARQAGAVAPGARQRWLLAREEAKAVASERALVAACDLTVVVSDDDRHDVTGGDPALLAKVVVAPNGVDPQRYAPSPLPAAPAVLMAGSFQYGPNVDGAEWFCAEVLPAVRAAVPDATLTLAGRAPAASVRVLADRPGVAVHADVASMADEFAAARLTVVPLRIGSGTRLKALESMAAGRPVVGTTIGLAGLGITDGVDGRVVDDPAATAAAVVQLLRDDAAAAAMAEAGRRLVVEHHDWTAIANAFAAAVLEGR